METCVTPLCPLADECGGCSSVNLPYDQQLADKQRRVDELFAPLLRGEGSPSVRPILGMDDPTHFRTKIVSPFAPAGRKRSIRSMARTGRAGKLALRRDDILCGMYAAGTHRIIECASCPVEHPVGRRVVAAVRQIMACYGVAPYNEDAGTGFMRHVVVRVGAHTGEVLVTLVTNAREFTGARNFCRKLVRAVPEITTIVQNVNMRQTNAIFGTEEHVLYGPGFILDTLCGLSFRISSNSFYQVNARQTEVLYSAAIGLALPKGVSGLNSATFGSVVLVNSEIASTAASAGIQSASAPSDSCTEAHGAVASGTISGECETLADSSTVCASPVILDAYCGTGTIGLVAAAAVPGAQVIGVDSVEAAIADARQNALHNGIENARFAARDAGEFMKDYAARGESADVVFMDPPRSGASEAFLAALLRLAPTRVVYISCNLETQLRDATALVEAGYILEVVQPVDMFPHTNHVECVALMSRTDG